MHLRRDELPHACVSKTAPQSQHRRVGIVYCVPQELPLFRVGVSTNCCCMEYSASAAPEEHRIDRRIRIVKVAAYCGGESECSTIAEIWLAESVSPGADICK